MIITISLNKEDINTYQQGNNLAIKNQDGVIITLTKKAVAELLKDIEKIGFLKPKNNPCGEVDANGKPVVDIITGDIVADSI